MTNDFHKFPKTPHLAVLADSVIRDDKVMSESEREMFLRHELVVEEKVDGANLATGKLCKVIETQVWIEFALRCRYMNQETSKQP